MPAPTQGSCPRRCGSPSAGGAAPCRCPVVALAEIPEENQELPCRLGRGGSEQSAGLEPRGSAQGRDRLGGGASSPPVEHAAQKGVNRGPWRRLLWLVEAVEAVSLLPLGSFPLFLSTAPELFAGRGDHPPFCWQQWKPPAHGSVAEACPARRAGDLGTVCRRLWGQQRALVPSRPPGPLPAPARSPLALAAAETRVPGREGFPSLSPLPRVTRRPRSAQ